MTRNVSLESIQMSSRGLMDESLGHPQNARARWMVFRSQLLKQTLLVFLFRIFFCLHLLNKYLLSSLKTGVNELIQMLKMVLAFLQNEK